MNEPDEIHQSRDGLWNIRVKSSPIVLLVRVQRTDEPADNTRERESLRLLLRSCVVRALEAGYVGPVVSLLVVAEGDAEETKKKAELYESWVRDPDWHGGEFLAFVEREANVEQRTDDLLGLAPELLKHEEFPSPPTMEEFTAALTRELLAARGGRPTLQALEAAARPWPQVFRDVAERDREVVSEREAERLKRSERVDSQPSSTEPLQDQRMREARSALSAFWREKVLAPVEERIRAARRRGGPWPIEPEAKP